jgi:hypothetical protein
MSEIKEIDENGAIINDDFISSEIKAIMPSLKTNDDENEEKIIVDIQLVEFRYRSNIHN